MKKSYLSVTRYFFIVNNIFLIVFNSSVGQAKTLETAPIITAQELTPVIEDQEFSIVEGSAPGTNLGNIVASGATGGLTYTITDAEFLGAGQQPEGDSSDDPAYDPQEVFSLNPDSGSLIVNNSKYLLEVLGPITLEVTVTNTLEEQSSATVTVAITDLQIEIEDDLDINWTTLANHPQGHSEATGGIVNGKLYVFSGFTANFAPKEAVFSYDIEENSWSRLANMPPMANDAGAGGATHMGFTSDSTNIYLAAGYAADRSGNAQQFASQRVYKYILEEDRYEELPPLPVERSAGALQYIANKLYYVAGTNEARDEDQSDLLVLDLDNLSSGWHMLPQMPNPRNHVGSTVFNGQLYVFGGQKEHDEDLVPQDDVHRYDPSTNSWSYVTDMPRAFNHIHASVFAYGDYIYSIGGQIMHNAGAYADVYAYNPQSEAWLQFTDLPAERFSIVAGAFDGKLFASGGNNSRTTYTANLPEAFLSIDQSLPQTENVYKVYPNPAQNQFSIGGINAVNSLHSVEIYDLNGKRLRVYEAQELLKFTNTFPLKNVPAGSYLLRITNENDEVVIKKLLVN